MLVLPIDVIPGSGPLRFRWRHRTDTLVGMKIVECEGALPPATEQAVAELVALAKRLHKELADSNEHCCTLTSELAELRGHAKRADNVEAAAEAVAWSKDDAVELSKGKQSSSSRKRGGA